jgi:hypothetical protein
MLVAGLLLTPHAANGQPTARAAVVHDCSVTATETMYISSVRNMSCHRAAKVMRQNRKPIRRRFHTRRYGFYCYRVSGSSYGGQWRCTKGSKAFRFDFAD